ncbi:hypothetical protein CK203_040504 [Vitis vinifera]|uniref:Zinc finger PMZ-type domain-containing protein n=1 Tax=Vitis vinifera TaxID=29760 RepID=A0A438I881_VITVI|nr:hypothetical protein CK203_040504 [Vitis vinifera]
MFCRVYVCQCAEGGDVFIALTSAPTPIVVSNSTHVSSIVRSTCAFLVIDDVVRSTPEYQPRQICKDFVRQHGIQLTYLQAWKIKENVKERIYGLPKNYYKLLPWMCERMIATNSGLSIELSYFDDGHFEQFFIAHSIYIQGFVMGCRPIIAIDLTHMSGPNGGALFSATAYDANDSMFPLAFGVMSSKNYEDCLWFLEKLKIVVGNQEIIIVLDRHLALLRSVLEMFGLENHAYCYRHLKENFSSFLSKLNTRGNKGKENTLQFLDSIAYARGWQMLGIPCEHVAAVIIFIGQNIIDCVNDYYNDDGLVRSITREVFFSLKPSHTKGLLECQGRSALSPNFKINGRKSFLSPAVQGRNLSVSLHIYSMKNSKPLRRWALGTIELCMSRTKDTIWDGDVGVQRNWAKFVFQYLEDGIRDYCKNHPTYIQGCLMFLQLFYMAYFYMPSIKVEVTSPLAVA